VLLWWLLLCGLPCCQPFLHGLLAAAAAAAAHGTFSNKGSLLSKRQVNSLSRKTIVTEVQDTTTVLPGVVTTQYEQLKPHMQRAALPRMFFCLVHLVH
jgi:hypothetical protein